MVKDGEYKMGGQNVKWGSVKEDWRRQINTEESKEKKNELNGTFNEKGELDECSIDGKRERGKGDINYCWTVEI